MARPAHPLGLGAGRLDGRGGVVARLDDDGLGVEVGRPVGWVLEGVGVAAGGVWLGPGRGVGLGPGTGVVLAAGPGVVAGIVVGPGVPGVVGVAGPGAPGPVVAAPGPGAVTSVVPVPVPRVGTAIGPPTPVVVVPVEPRDVGGPEPVLVATVASCGSPTTGNGPPPMTVSSATTANDPVMTPIAWTALAHARGCARAACRPTAPAMSRRVDHPGGHQARASAFAGSCGALAVTRTA